MKTLYKDKRDEILFWAKELANRSFVCGPVGNISVRVDKDKFLVTTHNAYLGYLEEDEIVLIDKSGNVLDKNDSKPTSELALHLGAYKFEEVNAVIHAHPAFTTAFYSNFKNLEINNFEARLYLSNITALEQDGPIVTNVKPVLKALETSNIVVLKRHGIVSIGSDFKQAFSLTQMLDETCKVNIALQSNPQKDKVDLPKTDDPSEELKKYKLFSKEHIDKIVSLVNNDSQIKEKGKSLDLTTRLAIKVDEENKVYNFHFNKGNIDKVTNDETAEFVISGSIVYWRLVFSRKLDPFAATTQRKLKLKGDMAKLSRWYAPFNRIFDLWKLAPAE